MPPPSLPSARTGRPPPVSGPLPAGRTSVPRWVAALASLALLLAACGGGSQGGGTDGAVAQGEQLYQTNCAGCHGSDLQGTRIGPPMLDEYYLPETTPDSQFVSAVNNGASAEQFDFGPMPAIPGLTDEQVQEIVDYVREQQREAGLLEE